MGTLDGNAQREITCLLQRAAEGDSEALGGVMPLVYEDLRGRAASFLRHEREGHTLQTTALLHEAYLRLVEHLEIDWQDRDHFQAVFATCMRRVLVDHARRRNAWKRGRDRGRVPLEEADGLAIEGAEQFLELSDAIETLARSHPRRGQLAELRLFGGLEFTEIARILGVSLSTVEKDWRLVRAWLVREATGGQGA